MKIKEVIKWRLKEQPSTESLRELVKDGILTKDEAREILFSSETEQERDENSLKAEIKFLRELVEKLSSNNNGRIIEIIKTVESPWRRWDWYGPYKVWCASSGNATCGGSVTLGNTSSSNSITFMNTSFSDLKTF